MHLPNRMTIPFQYFSIQRGEYHSFLRLGTEMIIGSDHAREIRSSPGKVP